MKSLYNEKDKAEILERLRKVGPDSKRHWGKMSSHQMVCHLTDSFKGVIGEKGISSADNFVTRTIVKWIALYAPLSWPKGVKTRPEMDQEIGGTSPVEFKKDIEDLKKMLDRVTQRNKDFEWKFHPIFGRMSEEEWLRWAYLHMDHHFRQFGI